MMRPYGFRAYYKKDVAPPKESEGLAIEVMWTTKDSRDMEAELAEKRPDIGYVERFEV